MRPSIYILACCLGLGAAAQAQPSELGDHTNLPADTLQRVRVSYASPAREGFGLRRVDGGASRARFGMNWASAANVYILHWKQGSSRPDDAAQVFRVARVNGIGTVRVFLGNAGTVARWRQDPSGTLADMKRLFDDAASNDIRLVLSNYWTHDAIEAAAGRKYASDREACRALATRDTEAWRGAQAFVEATVGAFGSHPAASSWEASNEPGFMLGVDAGFVTNESGARWLNAFQKKMHELGAARINMGGATFPAMSDDEIRIAFEHCDTLDDHLYTDHDSQGNDRGANARALVEGLERHVERVARLTGRDRDVMVGEFGNVPDAWFRELHQRIATHPWLALAWEYDGEGDDNWFSSTHRPGILQLLAASAPGGHAWTGSTAMGERPLATELGDRIASAFDAARSELCNQGGERDISKGSAPRDGVECFRVNVKTDRGATWVLDGKIDRTTHPAAVLADGVPRTRAFLELLLVLDEESRRVDDSARVSLRDGNTFLVRTSKDGEERADQVVDPRLRALLAPLDGRVVAVGVVREEDASGARVVAGRLYGYVAPREGVSTQVWDAPRDTPRTRALASLDRGERVTITGIAGNCYAVRVSYGDDPARDRTGYVPREDLSVGTPPPGAKATSPGFVGALEGSR
jgi:hypothetical protein